MNLFSIVKVEVEWPVWSVSGRSMILKSKGVKANAPSSGVSLVSIMSRKPSQ